jgi:NADPH:quinone reductase-like Zn-dependent oxidoreductase
MTVLLHKPNEGLADIEALFASGKVAPVIYKSYPLSAVPQALADFGAGRVVGKAAINVKEES